jgi:hypothetical protein
MKPAGLEAVRGLMEGPGGAAPRLTVPRDILAA